MTAYDSALKRTRVAVPADYTNLHIHKQIHHNHDVSYSPFAVVPPSLPFVASVAYHRLIRFANDAPLRAKGWPKTLLPQYLSINLPKSFHFFIIFLFLTHARTVQLINTPPCLNSSPVPSSSPFPTTVSNQCPLSPARLISTSSSKSHPRLF